MRGDIVSHSGNVIFKRPSAKVISVVYIAESHYVTYARESYARESNYHKLCQLLS